MKEVRNSDEVLALLSQALRKASDGRAIQDVLASLLADLHPIVGSQDGIVARIRLDSSGQPYHQVLAVESDPLGPSGGRTGTANILNQTVLDVLRTETVVRRSGADVTSMRDPSGTSHQRIGIPVFGDGRCVGCLALYREDTPFEPALAEHLSPVISAISTLLTLEQMRRHQQMSERRERDFVSVLSHELRTPMTLIRGSLGLINRLPEDSLPPNLSGLIAYANEGTRRIVRVLDDLVAVASIDAGRFQLKRGACFLSDIIADAVANQQHIAVERGVLIAVDTVPVVAMHLDEDRAAQVLIQLLSNAITVSSAGQEVRVTTELSVDQVMVHVADSGPGITAEALPGLFERFRPLDAPETRRYEGTGIGLYIAKQFARGHGGDIQVRTLVGEGSTFTVVLPRRMAGEERS